MKPTRRIFAAALVVLGVAGCKGADTALQVDVKAEAKTGYKLPTTAQYGGSGKAGDEEAHDHAFHLIDYQNLRDVVVWAHPGGIKAQSSSPPPLDAEVKLVAAEGTVYAMSVDGRLVLKNIGKKQQNVLLRGPGDELTELTVAPGAQAEHTPTKPGVVEVVREQDEEPIANVYVAPTPYARVVRAGEQVTFTGLLPGSYSVGAWHPILPGSTTTVQVAKGQTAKATLTVGVNSLPRAN